MKKIISLISIAALTLLAVNSATAESLKLVNSWPSNQTTVRIISDLYRDKVAALTNGKTTISAVGPEAISPLELLEPLQAGIVDMIYTHPAYHAGATKLGLSESGIAVNPSIWRSKGLVSAYDEYYQTLGVKVVMIAPLGEKGFRFVTRQAIDDKEHSFQGMKIRANPTYIGVIEKLGGTPVPLSGGEIYSSLQNGVIDGSPWATTGMLDFKLQEVSTHVVQPDFGSVNNWLLMNLDKWNSLDSDTQKALETAAIETEKYALAEMTRLANQELQSLQDAGLKVTRMNAAEAANIDKWMSESLWQLASQSSPEAAAKIRSIAKAAGLSE